MVRTHLFAKLSLLISLLAQWGLTGAASRKPSMALTFHSRAKRLQPMMEARI